MNLSNKLTISRILLTIVFIVILFVEGTFARYAALVIFAIACLTDFYDGWFARKRKEISSLGKLLDPIADKILVISAFLAFVELDLVPAWAVIVIIARELFVTALRVLGIAKGKILAADLIGKQKLVSQILAIFFILINLIIKETLLKYTYLWNEGLEEFFSAGRTFFVTLAVFFTAVSGWIYFRRNRDLFK